MINDARLKLQLPLRPLLAMAAVAVLAGLSVQASAVTLTDLLAGPRGKEYVYKTCGTNELKLFVFPPEAHEAGDCRPAMVWIHGGGWMAGNAEAFFPHARYSASRGAVGVSIDYRLVKVGGPVIADCIADCKSAIRYLRAHADSLGIDTNKIAVLGDSAGGHLAACLGTIDGFDDPADEVSVSAKVNLMVLYNPVLDLRAGGTASPEAGGGGFHKFAIGGAALGKKATPDDMKPTAESIALAGKISPLANVRSGAPPCLVMHGLDDQVVPAARSAKFAELMEKEGNVCRYLPLEGTRHAFIVTKYTATEQTVVDALRATDEFLAKAGYVSGSPTLKLSSTPAWRIKERSGK